MCFTHAERKLLEREVSCAAATSPVGLHPEAMRQLAAFVLPYAGDVAALEEAELLLKYVGLYMLPEALQRRYSVANSNTLEDYETSEVESLQLSDIYSGDCGEDFLQEKNGDNVSLLDLNLCSIYYLFIRLKCAAFPEDMDSFMFLFKGPENEIAIGPHADCRLRKVCEDAVMHLDNSEMGEFLSMGPLHEPYTKLRA